MAGYYIRRGSKLIGPVSVAKLRGLAAAGKLKPGDEIRKGDDGRWRPAESIKGLFAAAEPVDEWDALASMEAAGTGLDEYVPGDEADYEADDPEGGAYEPSSSGSTKPRRRGRSTSSGVDSSKLFWIGAIVSGVLVLVAGGVGLAIPEMGVTMMFGIQGLASVLGIVGGVWLLMLAFEEGATTGLLYLFLPCFSLYFFFSRFDGSMPFRLTIASWVLSAVAVLYGLVVGASLVGATP